MDQALLRSYFATIYELPSTNGALRVSLDGEIAQDMSALPPLLTKRFALLTAYNPRSMLLPRRVNEGRHVVLRDGLPREEAIFGGTSSGANVITALAVALRLGPGATVGTIIVDSGLRYLSTDVFKRRA